MSDVIYQNELRQILKTWVFSFDCVYCLKTSRISNTRIIVPLQEMKEEENAYDQPPAVVCDCEEILYNLASKDLFDLFESLFQSRNNNIYIPRSETPVADQPMGNDFELLNS